MILAQTKAVLIVTWALHLSLSNLLASASRKERALSCLITPEDVNRWRERSMLSGKQNTKGASVSGSCDGEGRIWHRDVRKIEKGVRDKREEEMGGWKRSRGSRCIKCEGGRE